MLTINKKIKITKNSKQVVFDLKDKLSEGEYDAQLVVDDSKENLKRGEEYDLKNWSSGIKLEDMPTFRREDIYGDDGR